MFKELYIIIIFCCVFSNTICYAAQSLGMLQHTSVIGTDINPTIDGGIINNTDNLPVYHPHIIDINSSKISQEKAYKTIQLIPNNFSDNLDNDSNQHFNDSWATSEKISNILDNAIETGKLQFILKQSKNLDLPASVALVPIVESEYKDNAISNKGAAGAWQLMPSTARQYGLNPSQRTQFIPATKAALMLLKNLHQQFGNWELAFAAYNAGSSRIQNALKQNPNATKIDELNLPIETKKYVASIHQINDVLINTNINQLNI